MGRMVLGVDPGQRVDPTALILCEELLPRYAPSSWRVPARTEVHPADITWIGGARSPTVHVVRHMERMHQQPYLKVARRVAEIARNASQLQPDWPLTVAVDATGLGRPVTETIRDELLHDGVRCLLSAVTLTAGERLTGVLGDPEIRLSKSVLVSNLTALFEARRVKLPKDHPEADAMLDELLAFEIRVSKDGHDKYEGRIGTHDDLVVALGLATVGEWKRPNVIKGYKGQSSPWLPD